jgi:predicted nucleic acid-binding protein
MIVVSDTSPLNYLILVGAEHVLPVVFDTVLAPQAVLLEMQHPKAPEKVRQWATTPPTWLEVRSPESTMQFDQLGPGEVEAIALAVQVQADKVLMDDREALEIARGLGLSCFGTLAVLDLAAEEGLVDLPTMISELAKTSFHAPQALIERLVERYEARKRD